MFFPYIFRRLFCFYIYVYLSKFSLITAKQFIKYFYLLFNNIHNNNNNSRRVARLCSSSFQLLFVFIFKLIYINFLLAENFYLSLVFFLCSSKFLNVAQLSLRKSCNCVFCMYICFHNCSLIMKYKTDKINLFDHYCNHGFFFRFTTLHK